MHKQLSQGENQGACSRSPGLSSSLIAAKLSQFKSNSWRVPAPCVKLALGASSYRVAVSSCLLSGQLRFVGEMSTQSSGDLMHLFLN